jgi:hypothetical protein
MLTYKVLCAIAAIGLGAAVVMVLPGFSPQADAGTPQKVVKSDRLDIRPVNKDCSRQAWPYYDATCLRDGRQVAGQIRPVRIVSTDRLAVQ